MRSVSPSIAWCHHLEVIVARTTTTSFGRPFQPLVQRSTVSQSTRTEAMFVDSVLLYLNFSFSRTFICLIQVARAQKSKAWYKTHHQRHCRLPRAAHHMPSSFLLQLLAGLLCCSSLTVDYQVVGSTLTGTSCVDTAWRL